MSGTSADAAGDVVGVDSGCPYFDSGAITPASGSCPEFAQTCGPAIGGPGSCLFSPIQTALAELLHTCASCGEVEAGFDHGCLTTVVVGPLGGIVAADAGDCVQSLALNTRWACAPDAGWVRVFLGSCTLN
jgi:hypothetical protein